MQCVYGHFCSACSHRLSPTSTLADGAAAMLLQQEKKTSFSVSLLLTCCFHAEVLDSLICSLSAASNLYFLALVSPGGMSLWRNKAVIFCHALDMFSPHPILFLFPLSLATFMLFLAKKECFYSDTVNLSNCTAVEPCIVYT